MLDAPLKNLYIYAVMNALKKLAIVINPKSGNGKSSKVLSELDILKYSGKVTGIFEWKKKDEVDDLLSQVFAWQPDAVIAVGGDGTVNLIGSSLIHKNIPMGIIPAGSGNGLARHLGIPIETDKAIKKLIDARTIKIDAGKINQHHFFCTAGLGFDAVVANRFAGIKNRGLIGYSRESLLSIGQLKPEIFTLQFNDERHIFNALILTFANAAQFGNNAFIAPRASIMDGKIDLTVIEKIGLLHVPGLIYRLFAGNIDKSSSVHTFVSEKFFIQREKTGFLHFDGETAACSKNISVSILPSALTVLV